MIRKICFATNNRHKVEEVKHVIGEQFEILTLNDIDCNEELPETHDTLEGNSLEKAQYVFQHYKIPCFADDTGLEVEALQGAPGVFSARYAGPQKNSDDNISLLLNKLKDNSNRKARFRTVITCIGLSSEPITFEGVIKGHIIQEKRGAEGFGYDPVFIPEGCQQTFAEMSLAEKNRLSHRALAVNKLALFLKEL